jgi:aspartokinase-like uncharacterized kinase
MWVVKLGGSLAHSEILAPWLHALARTDAAIVPGGGPFADQVRKAQARWRFEDRTAHDMAILAMRQYGLMLASLGGLRTGTSPDEMAADVRKGLATIWLPLPENLGAAGVPASWDITSDSLAAWLARQLGATHLLLVKSLPRIGREAACDRLILDGIIDPAFGSFSAGASFQCWLGGRDDHHELADALQKPTRRFTRITASCAAPESGNCT